jgi:hypothetical protein
MAGLVLFSGVTSSQPISCRAGRWIGERQRQPQNFPSRRITRNFVIGSDSILFLDDLSWSCQRKSREREREKSTISFVWFAYFLHDDCPYQYVIIDLWHMSRPALSSALCVWNADSSVHPRIFQISERIHYYKGESLLFLEDGTGALDPSAESLRIRNWMQSDNNGKNKANFAFVISASRSPCDLGGLN